MKRIALGIAIVALAASAACGGSNKVGSNSLLNVKDQAQKDRLGAATTTIAPAATTTSAASLGIGRATTTIRSTETTAAREFVIVINSDKGGTQQFDPNSGSVYTNYPVRWQNNDSVPRSIVFDNNAHPGSGDIAPGKSWTTTFATPGTFHYTDGTRPYAVASITIAAR